MGVSQFSDDQLKIVNEAVEIAEDITANYYKIPASEWRYLRYDIKTHADLHHGEITDKAFAQVIKYSPSSDLVNRVDQLYDFYLICLQDHLMLRALEREKELDLLTLTLYIITHELVHVVRFFKFATIFEAPERLREREESAVHAITFEILTPIKWPKLQFLLKSYEPYRKIDEVLL